MKTKELLKKDYYGQEANQRFMSVSQFKDFLDCEARALATLKGEYKPPKDVKALLVGNYVHTYFESPEAHARFREKNYDLMFKEPTVAQLKKNLKENEVDLIECKVKKDYVDLHNEKNLAMPETELLSEFRQAEVMIETVDKEPLFNYLWQGERELTVTGELFGVDWKGRCDLVNLEKGYFIDLKTARSLNNKIWAYDPKEEKERYVSFIEAYGYIYQIAVYEQLLSQKYNKPFVGYLYIVTKETTPDVEAVAFSGDIKEFYLELIERRIKHIIEVKNEQSKPASCGHCDYCKIDKVLTQFSYYDGGY